MSAINFQKGAKDGVVLEFPITKENFPEGPSDLVNPMVGNAHGLEAQPGVETEEFQEELGDVVKVRSEVERGIWPSWLFEKWSIDPAVPEGLRFLATDKKGQPDPQAAAAAVRMDWTGDLFQAMVRWMQSKGMELDYRTEEGHVDFLGMMWALEVEASEFRLAKLRKCFEVKGYFGRPRPEEMLNLKGKDFTAYEEGCPCHAEDVPGHATAAGASAYYALNELKWKTPPTAEIRDGVCHMASHFAFWRELAGVHTGLSNKRGVDFGFGEGFPWAAIADV